MFYIFHGDDSHSQKETVANLISKMDDPSMLDLNTTRLDSRATFTELRQSCDAMPFLAKVRLVVVTDLLSSKPDKEFVDQLAAYLPALPETTRLIFLESSKLRENHRLLKLAEELKTGYVKLFTRPEGSALERWIREKVAEKGGRIQPRAAHLLAANVGNDLQLLYNEIEKLVLYKGWDGNEPREITAREITAEDVTLLCPYLAEANIFDLVDAIGNRNGKQAALLLQHKFNEGVDPFYLFAMFVRQFRLLIQVKELADEGQNPPAIALALKMHSFVVGKIYQQARGFSLSQLEHIYRHLLDIDVGVKTGRTELPTALNLLVAGLTVEE
jgi:DNA polymerase III subunit delta